MKKLLQRITLAAAALVLFSGVLALAVPQTSFAVTTQQAACEAINGTAGCTKENSDLTSILEIIINVMSVIIGFIAVVMIVVAGFKYITSGGDTAKVTTAKNALIYALIGLVIVGLAQFLVRVVIRNTDKIATVAVASI